MSIDVKIFMELTYTDGCSCSEVQDEQEMAPEDLMMVEMAASTRLLADMG